PRPRDGAPSDVGVRRHGDGERARRRHERHPLRRESQAVPPGAEPGRCRVAGFDSGDVVALRADRARARARRRAGQHGAFVVGDRGCGGSHPRSRSGIGESEWPRCGHGRRGARLRVTRRSERMVRSSIDTNDRNKRAARRHAAVVALAILGAATAWGVTSLSAAPASTDTKSATPAPAKKSTTTVTSAPSAAGPDSIKTLEAAVAKDSMNFDKNYRLGVAYLDRDRAQDAV